MKDKKLTPRENEVAILILDYTYKETASKLGITLPTVKSHVRNIYGKLDVPNKTRLLIEMHRLGYK